MVKTAVILAAGLGSRLKDRTKIKPKGFLEIDAKPLIIHSIEKILDSGIEKIIIGTGYHNEYYDELSKTYPQIITVKNLHFESTGSFYTLYNLKDVVEEDFLLFESDLIYEKNALKVLLDNNISNLVLGSGTTNSGDEVYIESDALGQLINMSKQRENLGMVSAELVGITKISKLFFNTMCRLLEDTLEENRKIDYETVIVKASQVEPIKVLKVDDLAWCEIDDESHLKRALEEVYPKILKRDL